MLIRSVLGPAVAVGLLTVAAAQEPPAAQGRARLGDDLRVELERQRVACDAPGLTAAVAFGADEVEAVACGVRELGEDEPLRANDRLFCGSVGKTWFAAVTLQIVAEGRLSLDDRVSRFLGDEPWFSKLPNHDRITVRNLLRHDSGLPRWIEADGALRQWAEGERVWAHGEQLRFVEGAAPVHDVAAGWAYSDTNYIVLGLCVEKVVRRPIYELVQERLLDTNRLRDTVPGDRRAIDGLVQGHLRMFTRFGFPSRALEDGKLTYDPSAEWCGGGYVTSAPDLARWARLYGRDDARTRDAVPARALGPGTRYGLGVMLRDTELGPTRGHDGVFLGYGATMLWFERHDLGVAVLANADDCSHRLARAAVALAKIAVASGCGHEAPEERGRDDR